MKCVRATLVLLVAVFSVSVASAQTGALEVSVTDEEGQPLPGAVVTISHEQGYIKETGSPTDPDGIASFPVLRATGTSGKGYTINVSFPGHASQRHDGVMVSIGKTMKLAVQLTPELVERVRVEARSDVVQLEETSQSMKFSDEFIQDLPVPGRFYQNVLTLAPGVQDADGDGNPNVHGARDRDFKAVVSGISNVDPLTGQRMFDVNPNSIEEMEVLVAGAGIEFRRAQGGFARILQKQGSNDFEGVFEVFFSSGALDGDGAGDFSDVPTPEFESYQPSVQVSGPIIKDKLWYRLSHEWVHEELPINVTDGIEIQTDERTINSDQITWQASPRNKLAFQFQSDPREISNFGVSSFTPGASSSTLELGGETYSLTWTAPYSPKILIESQAAWQDLNIGQHPTDPGARADCLIGPEFLYEARCFDLDSGQVSGAFPFDLDDHRQRFTVRGDATVFGGRMWGATHQFKFGMSVENERYYRELTQRPDVDLFIVTIADDPGGGQADPEPHAIILGDFAVPEFTTVRATGITWGFYAEDQIKPLSNLTVTVGAAVDREEINSEGNGTFTPESEYQEFLRLIDSGLTNVQALQIPFTKYENQEDFFRQLSQQVGIDYDVVYSRQTLAAQNAGFWEISRRSDNVNLTNTNVSPFLSLAWDPWSNGKTKFAGSFRRYYGAVPLVLPLEEIDSATATVAFDATQVEGGWRIQEGAAGLRNSISPSVNVEAVDRDMKTPYNDEWSVSFEREIATETSMKVTYINRKFRDQFQDIDLNHIPMDAGRCVATRPSGPFMPVQAPGDGIIDDCAGELEFFPGTDPVSAEDDINLEKPDGIPDLYVQNAGWGNVLFIGNLNEIDYDGVTLELTRRQYQNWELQGSYTWSKAIGNGEDFSQALGNDRTLVEDEQGYQAYDQRHVVKVTATTVTPWGIRLGGAVTWQSGLPYSLLNREISFDAVPPEYQGLGTEGAGRPRTTYKVGQRNTERNVAWWNFDVRVSKEFRLGRGVNGQASIEAFNLLNDGTYQVYNLASETGQQVNGNNEAIRRFGRQWQLGLRLAF
jgi:hypothetical protein